MLKPQGVKPCNIFYLNAYDDTYVINMTQLTM